MGVATKFYNCVHMLRWCITGKGFMQLPLSVGRH